MGDQLQHDRTHVHKLYIYGQYNLCLDKSLIHAIRIVSSMYRIVQNFDRNIDRFDAQLAIHQNFPFQYFLIVKQIQAV